MNTERLLFRRQFLLSPRKIAPFPEWIELTLPQEYYLSVHPDLTVTTIAHNDNHVTLLGYVLDPDTPGSTDESILHQFVGNSRTIQELISKFYGCAGRYACIAYIGNNFYCFSDTLGFRSIYYHFSGEQFWCASQSALLARSLHMQPDPAIEDDFNKLDMFKNSTEYWYPGTISPYREISNILPNHYLNCKNHQQIRYWPNEALENISFEQSADSSAQLLGKIMESARARFDLKVAVTSGLDSRMVLAACRSISTSTDFFTHTHSRLTLKGVDITLPSTMLKHFGLHHEIIEHPEVIDPLFKNVFKQNVTNARKGKCLNAFTMHTYFNKTGKEDVVVHGVPGEITRNFFSIPPGIYPSAELLGELTRMSASSVALDEFEKWLQETQVTAFKHGVRILDLFYWEQRTGNWAATSYNEYDIAFETFTPFSCRNLLTMMLGVGNNKRIAPEYALQKAIIKRLWPELIKYPINPAESITMALRKSLINSPVYTMYTSIKFLKHSSLFSDRKSKNDCK